jgi:hypothetical protein
MTLPLLNFLFIVFLLSKREKLASKAQGLARFSPGKK